MAERVINLDDAVFEMVRRQVSPRGVEKHVYRWINDTEYRREHGRFVVSDPSYGQVRSQVPQDLQLVVMNLDIEGAIIFVFPTYEEREAAYRVLEKSLRESK